MASITVRNIDERVKEQLRVAAARAGHSMEEHVRRLIEQEVGDAMPTIGFGSWMHGLFHGIDATDLTIPARTDPAEPIQLPK